MTHPFKGLSYSWDTPELPEDFAEKSAYMRLAVAQKMHDVYWPREAFGDEITLLLARGHAEVHEGGYRLTAAGKAFWKAFTRRYAAHSDAPLHDDVAEGAVAS